MDSFINREEAEAMVEKMNANVEYAIAFCPLINQRCKINCVCYEKARIWEERHHAPTPDIDYHVVPPQCGNAMFFEKEIVHG